MKRSPPTVTLPPGTGGGDKRECGGGEREGDADGQLVSGIMVGLAAARWNIPRMAIRGL